MRYEAQTTGQNFYALDVNLRGALRRSMPDAVGRWDATLEAFGAWVGEAVDTAAAYTDSRGLSLLEPYDRDGEPVNRIRTNPAWDAVSREAYERGVVGLDYGSEAGPVRRHVRDGLSDLAGRRIVALSGGDDRRDGLRPRPLRAGAAQGGVSARAGAPRRQGAVGRDLGHRARRRLGPRRDDDDGEARRRPRDVERAQVVREQPRRWAGLGHGPRAPRRARAALGSTWCRSAFATDGTTRCAFAGSRKSSAPAASPPPRSSSPIPGRTRSPPRPEGSS